MDISSNLNPSVTHISGGKPSPDERRQLRRHYFMTALIMITLAAVFNGINNLVSWVAGGILGGGFSKEEISEGMMLLRSTPALSAIRSYLFPLAADLAAFGVGVAVTKFSLKDRLRFTFTGSQFCDCTACTFTMAAVGSFVMMMIYAVVMVIKNGENPISSLETTADAVSVVKGNYPLWLNILVYLYVCLLGPIVEELVFRGVLLDGLCKYGNRFGIIMSSVLFGLMHENFIQCIPTICIGLVFASITVRTGSLIPSIAVHILNNSMSAFLMIIMHDLPLNDLMTMNTGTLDITAFMPLILTALILVLFRLVCLVWAVIAVIKYFGRHGRLIPETEYTKARTWKYFFTSVPWLIVLIFLLYNTVTSIV
ncbi:MAG: lysostaphin resistance A-like protein [Huintestinicola sp.]